MDTQALEVRDLEDLLNGAAFLSSGGGGPRRMAERMLADVVRRRRPIPFQALSEVEPEGTYAVIAYLGAPEAGEAEQTFEGPTNAVRTIERALGKKLAGVVPVEIGAVSSFAPITVAARLGIPVVDCDGAGRAVPEMTMTTYAIRAPSIAPVVMATEHPETERGQSVVFYVDDAGQAEELARPIVSSATFGNLGGLALWAMAGKDLQGAAIGGTQSWARDLGAALRRSRDERRDPVTVVLDYLQGGAALLCRGRVASIQQQTAGGFDCGLIELAGEGEVDRVWIYSQNESLLAWRSDRSSPLLMSPDLLCYLTPHGLGVSNADLAQGQEVALIGAVARPELRSPRILAAFLDLLRGLGYRGPYVPFDPSAVVA